MFQFVHQSSLCLFFLYEQNTWTGTCLTENLTDLNLFFSLFQLEGNLTYSDKTPVRWSSDLPAFNGGVSDNRDCVAIYRSDADKQEMWTSADCSIPKPFICQYHGTKFCQVFASRLEYKKALRRFEDVDV